MSFFIFINYPRPTLQVWNESHQFTITFCSSGYTSATFSGRSAMPLLADSIVECGRRTLTNAIMLANKWGCDASGPWKGAKVIYGKYSSSCQIVLSVLNCVLTANQATPTHCL